MREAAHESLHPLGPGVSGARPFVDTSAIDRDQRELDGNETGIGGHERKGGKQPERGVDRSSRLG